MIDIKLAVEVAHLSYQAAKLVLPFVLKEAVKNGTIPAAPEEVEQALKEWGMS